MGQDMDYLQQLLQWWQAELDATRLSQQQERSQRPWYERLRTGHALTALTFDRRERKTAATVFLWFRRQDRKVLPHRRVRSGYGALLWPMDGGEDAALRQQRGTIVRVTDKQVCLRFPTDYDRFIERGTLNLERESSEVTFSRGRDAIVAFMDRADQRALWFGDGVPRFAEAGDIDFRDDQLDPTQRRAVEGAVAARDVALIHGPPGTGKTRTLVEVVRQALLLRRRILVTAASNVAVDNLARRLADCGVKVLRLGAENKVAPDLLESGCTLHHKMAQLQEMADAQAQFDAAQRIADGK
ncbi:MAG: AAA family ATPase, partial [Deltaproteobacteria bacterium]|nr:AAA family ATPase [Deltaproteobacteria bacterium]